MEDIKFEDALDRLESIVKLLESGELPLEEALKAFEEGVKLARICSKRLDEAEKRIEILIKGEDGELHVQDFDARSPEE